MSARVGIRVWIKRESTTVHAEIGADSLARRAGDFFVVWAVCVLIAEGRGRAGITTISAMLEAGIKAGAPEQITGNRLLGVGEELGESKVTKERRGASIQLTFTTWK